MSTDLIMFYLLAGVIGVFSILTVTSRKILRAAIFLLFVLVATAGLYFMMDFQFMAGVQLTLYAGGIVVLIIFSILLTSRVHQKFDLPDLGKIAMAVIAALSGLALTLYTILDYTFTPSGKEPVSRNMDEVGRQLMSVDFNGYALPFEVISILLLAAMIGAIIIAKKGK